MPTAPTRRRLALAALVCLVPLAAGCGGSDGGAGAIDDIAGAVGGDEAAAAVRVASAVQKHAEELRVAGAEVQKEKTGSKKWKAAVLKVADAADAAAAEIAKIDADGAGVAVRDQAAEAFRQMATSAREAADNPDAATGYDPTSGIPSA